MRHPKRCLISCYRLHDLQIIPFLIHLLFFFSFCYTVYEVLHLAPSSHKYINNLITVLLML
jgi:hypothetical protein